MRKHRIRLFIVVDILGEAELAIVMISHDCLQELKRIRKIVENWRGMEQEWHLNIGLPLDGESATEAWGIINIV